MPFVKTEENGGQVDPNINRKGRTPKSDEVKLTAKKIKQKEFMFLLRKLKPLQARAINAAAKILDGGAATEAGKLRAAALLISTYKDLVKEVYDIDVKPDDDEAGEIDQSKAPLFSLTVMGDESTSEN